MYDTLTPTETTTLWTGMHTRFDFPPPPPNPTPEAFADRCEMGNYQPADLVLGIIQRSTEEIQPILKKLIGREMYVHVPGVALATPQLRKRRIKKRKQDDRKITLLSTENPKKPNSKSYERFALYRSGMTVTEFVNAGGTAADVKWDAQRGFINVS